MITFFMRSSRKGREMMVRKHSLLTVCSVVFSLLLVSSTAFSEANSDPVVTGKPVKEIINESLSQGKGICTVVGDMIRAGNDTGETVESAILAGHSACTVVRCAVEAGGKLDDVVAGAFRAGASSDVIVTCCVDGGAESADLARIIERLGLPGLGYTPPAQNQVYVPTYVSTIGGGGGVSASPFRP